MKHTGRWANDKASLRVGTTYPKPNRQGVPNSADTPSAVLGTTFSVALALYIIQSDYEGVAHSYDVRTQHGCYALAVALNGGLMPA